MKIAIYHGRRLLDVVTGELARETWQEAEQRVRRQADLHNERGGRGWFREGPRVGFERGLFRAMYLGEVARPSLAKRAALEAASAELSRSLFCVHTTRVMRR